jgi:hypothetical protein
MHSYYAGFSRLFILGYMQGVVIFVSDCRHFNKPLGLNAKACYMCVDFLSVILEG